MGELGRPTYTTTDSKTGRKVRRQSRIWWIRYYRNGKRYEESSHSDKKTVAKALLAQREGDIANDLPVTSEVGKLRFDDAAADVVADYRVNGKRSLCDVERRLRLHLKSYFGGRRMVSITTTDVRENLPEHPRGVVTFAYLTGWRVPSEILSLQRRQVDRKTKTIRLEPGSTKNKKGRTLPYDLLPELKETIEVQWQTHQLFAERGAICPLVFNRNGKSIKSIRGAWQSACKKAGVPGRIPHDSRRQHPENSGLTRHSKQLMADSTAVCRTADSQSRVHQICTKNEGALFQGRQEGGIGLGSNEIGR